MKKLIYALLFATSFCLFVLAGLAKDAGQGMTGEQLFQKHCAVCHPNGSNIVNPADTLYRKTLAAHDIKTPADIIGKMRKPGPGMTKFDKKTLPDGDAKKIAEYILKTFR